MRVLTQEEKLSLAINSTFQEKCKQAVRDFSAYWSIHDGAGFSTLAERQTWAKNQINGVAFMKNPIINIDGLTLAWFFLNGAKGKQYDLGLAPIDSALLIQTWDANNSFEEFVSVYFAILGNEIDMNATGN